MATPEKSVSLWVSTVDAAALKAQQLCSRAPKGQAARCGPLNFSRLTRVSLPAGLASAAYLPFLPPEAATEAP